MKTLEVSWKENGYLVPSHNMPCPICVENKALYDEIFNPCWDCQKQGYRTLRLDSYFKNLIGNFIEKLS